MLYLLALVCLVTASFATPVKFLDGKIVGGTDVSINQYPYQLSFQHSGYHACGASIISELWVLTAAHCTGVAVEVSTFRAGSSFRDFGGKVYQASEKIVHSQYIFGEYDYDIALYKVTEPFHFGVGVFPIPLPSQQEPVAIGAACEVSGWGTTSEAGSSPSQLQAITVPVMSHFECLVAYEFSLITSRMICAGLHAGGIDSCQGDSGGPMVSGGKLVGVVSWGYGCARPDLPGVYSRVASLRDWIRENSGI